MIADRPQPRLLDRILASPHLDHVVPRLRTDVLHRVIQHCGLEDCGPLVALATPDQLAGLFDLDLWRPALAGCDEQFDADRFGAWVEVMATTDVPRAAATLAAMDVDLIAAGIAQHVRVFHNAAVAPYVMLDGEEASAGFTFDDGLSCVVAGYLVCAKRSHYWDALTTVLIALAEAHGDCFAQVMRRCCLLSNSRPEVDGLDDLAGAREQAMFDLALGREARRDVQGFVTPAQARAFLQASRRLDTRPDGPPPRDPVTHAYFRGLEARTTSDPDHESRPRPMRDRMDAEPLATANAIATIVDLLNEAGAGPRPPRGLLEGPQASGPLARVRAHLQFARDRDVDAYATRNAELAYLANVIAAGSTIQSRPVPAADASKAAMAVCNLGLENWPAHWLARDARRVRPMPGAGSALPEDFLVVHDLLSVFQVGWTVLHEDVCMYAAERLVDIVAAIRCADEDLRVALAALRVRLTRHWRAGSPWGSREALDVIAVLDGPAWAAVVGLIDQLPTLHGAVGALLDGSTRQVDASAFEFISGNAQIRVVHEFMRRLPGILGAGA